MIENLNIWIGTRDDYIGSTDRPLKTKGDFVNTGSGFIFQESSDSLTPSSVVQVTSSDDGVFFYSRTEGVNTSISSCCSFSNTYSQPPTNSPLRPEGDGSYSIYIPLGQLNPGESKEFDTYYGAGSLADLARIAGEIGSFASGCSNGELDEGEECDDGDLINDLL